MKRAIIIGAVIVVVGGGVALGVWLMNPSQPAVTPPVNESGPSVATDAPATETTVRMQNTKFSPATITIKKGTKVTWTNDDSTQHNVVASDSNSTGGLPTQNSLLGKGGSYSFTFDTAGTFKYHCTPHPFMTGTVVVE